MADPSSSSPSMSTWAFMLSWFTPTSLFLLLNLVIGTIVLSSRFGTHKKSTQHQQEQLGSYNSPPLVRAPSLLERVLSIDFSHVKFEEAKPEPEALRPTEPEYVVEQHSHPDNSTGLTRTPSLLDRVRSINFSNYKFEQPNPEPEYVASQHSHSDNLPGLARTPSLLYRLKSMDFSSFLRSEHAEPESKYHDESESGQEAHDPNPMGENLVHWSKSDSGGRARVNQQGKIKKTTSEKSPLGGVERNEAVEERRPTTARVEKTLSFGSDEGVESVDAKADDFINRFKQQLRLQRADSLLRYKEILKRNLI